MIDELDAFRKWGEAITPSPSQKKHARALLQAAIAEQSTSRSTGRVRRIRRPIALAVAGLIVGATAAVAAVYQFSPQPALELEGRSIVEGSLEQRRSILVEDLEWTAYAYETDDGLICFDLDLTSQAGQESLGSTGSCTVRSDSRGLQGAIGGVSLDGTYRQVLVGIAPPGTESIRAVADDGTVLSDFPENDVWILAPAEPKGQWVIESHGDEGPETVVLIDGDFSAGTASEGRDIEQNETP